MRSITRVYEAPDGSQVLLTQWNDGNIDVATRPDSSESTVWGPPLVLKRIEPQGPLMTLSEIAERMQRAMVDFP